MYVLFLRKEEERRGEEKGARVERQEKDNRDTIDESSLSPSPLPCSHPTSSYSHRLHCEINDYYHFSIVRRRRRRRRSEQEEEEEEKDGGGQ